MYKSGRPGYVTLTLEVPIAVADWLAVHGDELAKQCAIAVAKAERQSQATKQDRESGLTKRLDELVSLGRSGYRLFRRYCGRKHISRHRQLIAKLADQIGTEPTTLELAIKRFKKGLDDKVRNRRNREIYRLWNSGQSNDAIATHLKVHKATVKRIIQQFPGKPKLLKNNKKGKVPGLSQGSPFVVARDTIKQAGGRK